MRCVVSGWKKKQKDLFVNNYVLTAYKTADLAHKSWWKLISYPQFLDKGETNGKQHDKTQFVYSATKNQEDLTALVL